MKYEEQSIESMKTNNIKIDIINHNLHYLITNVKDDHVLFNASTK